jgi:hypothetical protein
MEKIRNILQVMGGCFLPSIKKKEKSLKNLDY